MDAVAFLNSVNWQTIIGMFAITWYFTHDLKLAIEKQTARTDRLYEMYCETQKEIKQIYLDILKERK